MHLWNRRVVKYVSCIGAEHHFSQKRPTVNHDDVFKTGFTYPRGAVFPPSSTGMESELGCPYTQNQSTGKQPQPRFSGTTGFLANRVPVDYSSSKLHDLQIHTSPFPNKQFADVHWCSMFAFRISSNRISLPHPWISPASLLESNVETGQNSFLEVFLIEAPSPQKPW